MSDVDTGRMAPEAAAELAERVLRLAEGEGASEAEVLVAAGDEALTRFANSEIHQNVAESDVRVNLRFLRGKRAGVASSGRTDPEALRRLAETAGRIAAIAEEQADWPGLPSAEPAEPAPGVFSEGTAGASPELRAAGVRAVIAAADAFGVAAFGSFSTSVETIAVATSTGTRVSEARTSSRLLAVTMGPDDGTGYAEAAAVDATTIDAPAIGREAAEKARRASHPIALPPGDYPVVLEEYAVADLLDNLGFVGFSGLAVEEERSFFEPGKRIGSELVTIVDDARDPAGMPASFDYEGVPTRRVPMVEAGVCREVVHDAATAARAGVPSTGHGLPAPNPWGPFPLHAVMAPGCDAPRRAAPRPAAGPARDALPLHERRPRQARRRHRHDAGRDVPRRRRRDRGPSPEPAVHAVLPRRPRRRRGGGLRAAAPRRGAGGRAGARGAHRVVALHGCDGGRLSQRPARRPRQSQVGPSNDHNHAVTSIPDHALDAIVVGSGPNGLVAAITLARAGLAVRVYEGASTAGGGLRSAELTLPGFVHDPCATVVATALVSPFFRTLDLAALGVEMVHPDVAAAHVLAPDRTVLLHRSVDETAAGLGRDGAAWRRLVGPLAHDADRLMAWALGPVPRPTRHLGTAIRFGPAALLPAAGLARLAFREEAARSLLGALAAHASVPLESAGSAASGLVLAITAHAVGWPVVRGGSQRLADALVGEVRRLGGEVVTDAPVASLADLPPARASLLDVAPRQLVALAGDRAPAGYVRRLERFRHGPGVSKVDWALDGPIPWRDPDLARAGTIHLGGPLGQIATAERAVAAGRMPRRPFIILVQATVMDRSRAPAGRHTAWAYAHVPHGSDVDATPLIEAEIERAAPGFRDRVLARHARTAAGHEAYNPNYVGGDIGGGLATLGQLIARPTLAWDPYRTPLRGVYLCSSSTPPGGGVHGMAGIRAARSALRHEFGIRS